MSDKCNKNCMTDRVNLHDTMDAKIWADEFCKINTASDHGTMLGWFANAIMTGYDKARTDFDPDYGICCGNFEKYTTACIPRAEYWKEKYQELNQMLHDNELKFTIKDIARMYQKDTTRGISFSKSDEEILKELRNFWRDDYKSAIRASNMELDIKTLYDSYM